MPTTCSWMPFSLQLPIAKMNASIIILFQAHSCYSKKIGLGDLVRKTIVSCLDYASLHLFLIMDIATFFCIKSHRKAPHIVKRLHWTLWKATMEKRSNTGVLTPSTCKNFAIVTSPSIHRALCNDDSEIIN